MSSAQKKLLGELAYLVAGVAFFWLFIAAATNYEHLSTATRLAIPGYLAASLTLYLLNREE